MTQRPVTPRSKTPRSTSPRRPDARVARGLSGVLTGGLVALAIVMCLAQWLAAASGRPGPGTPAVAGHVVAALAGIVLQLAAERSRGRLATLASWSVLMLSAAVLWLGWWA